jgi:hypothetical protein
MVYVILGFTPEGGEREVCPRREPMEEGAAGALEERCATSAVLPLVIEKAIGRVCLQEQ